VTYVLGPDHVARKLPLVSPEALSGAVSMSDAVRLSTSRPPSGSQQLQRFSTSGQRPIHWVHRSFRERRPMEAELPLSSRPATSGIKIPSPSRTSAGIRKICRLRCWPGMRIRDSGNCHTS
jgi:hypothetical protein